VRRAALLTLPAVASVAAAAAIAFPTGSAGPSIEVVRISSGNGIATGLAVAARRVVTVAHVIDGPVTARSRRVRVLRVDRRNDLALLSVPGVGATAPGIAGAANGEHLRVVRLRGGRPSSLSVDVRRAIVAHVRAPGAERALHRPALELSARVAPGDSGAPVITDDGAVAAIVFAASRRRRNTAYAVDATALRRLLR
jgi:S1-C subfamily serine protease